jgi:hypothetical protein
MGARREDIDPHDLIARYLAGDSPYALGRRYGATYPVIVRILRENSIPIRGRGETGALLRRDDPSQGTIVKR